MSRARASHHATSADAAIQGKTSLEATVNTSARSWTIADLPPNVQHHFDVRAYNASGESRADACSVDVTRR